MKAIAQADAWDNITFECNACKLIDYEITECLIPWAAFPRSKVQAATRRWAESEKRPEGWNKENANSLWQTKS